MDGIARPGRGHPAALAAEFAALTAEFAALAADGRLLPGPATTLEVLGGTAVEAHHERLIAWLLDPLAAHGLGPAVLGAVLRRFRPAAGVPRGLLLRARVRRQAAGASSRPDILVTLPDRTLVIELKIGSPEGPGQTARQADDHAHLPDPVLVYLTPGGLPPGDGRFRPLALADLARDLAAALAAAPEPASPAAARGRAVVRDYLATLERMLGMDPVDQEAAHFWLTHRQSLLQARQSARRLLALLPGRVAGALVPLAAALGEDVSADAFTYTVRGATGREFTEHAALLSRRHWPRDPAGRPRFGIGFGQRADPDPEVRHESPFWGVYTADPALRTALRTAWSPHGEPWGDWALWEYADLDAGPEPPPPGGDPLTRYAEGVAAVVREGWHRYAAALDAAVTGPAASATAPGPAGPAGPVSPAGPASPAG